MRQRDPSFGVTFSREEVARVIGIAADEIPPEWPVQIVSTGLPFAIVGYSQPKNYGESKLLSCAGRRISLRTPKPGSFTFSVRIGTKAGWKQRRACSFMAGKIQRRDQRRVAPRAGWSNAGSLRVTNRLLIRQGVEIRRPSEIHVRATRNGQCVRNVRVGGYAVEVLRGTVRL